MSGDLARLGALGLSRTLRRIETEIEPFRDASVRREETLHKVAQNISQLEILRSAPDRQLHRHSAGLSGRDNTARAEVDRRCASYIFPEHCVLDRARSLGASFRRELGLFLGVAETSRCATAILYQVLDGAAASLRHQVVPRREHDPRESWIELRRSRPHPISTTVPRPLGIYQQIRTRLLSMSAITLGVALFVAGRGGNFTSTG